MKRLMQRQGQVGADGAPVRQRPQPRPQPRAAKERTTPAEFIRQVRAELRKVAWPDRAEVVNYSIIVFIVLVIVIFMTSLIFGYDYLSAKLVLFLFD